MGWALQRVEKKEEDMLGNKRKERVKEEPLIELEQWGLRMEERRAMKALTGNGGSSEG